MPPLQSKERRPNCWFRSCENIAYLNTNRTTPFNSPHAARLVLAHIGLLSIANQRRHRVVPLVVSESLWRDLEKFDNISERESIRAAVLFARSGHDTIDEMVNNTAITQEFTDFLQGLGWAVDLAEHHGLHAGLNESTGRTALYFATRNVEAVFHVPYALNLPLSSPSPTLAAAMAPLTPSATKPLTAKRSLMRSVFQQLTQDDLVYIIWIEDLTAYLTIPRKLGRGQVFIFVHPVPNSWGLYLVRMHTAMGTPQVVGGGGSRSTSQSTDETQVRSPNARPVRSMFLTSDAYSLTLDR
jgi:hypothetical protein